MKSACLFVRMVAALALAGLFLAGCQATPDATATSQKTVQPSLPAPTATATPTPTSKPPVTAAPTATEEAHTTDDNFAALLEELKLADPAFDFTALRMAYAASEGYDPYAFGVRTLVQSMFEALEAEDYEEALDLTEQVVATYYLSPDAHLGAIIAHEGLGNDNEAEFHRYVLFGVIDSILASGDGRSMETAFIVVSIDEEYAVLEVLGIDNSAQSLVHEGEHSFDQFEGIDSATGEKVVLFFNIDLVYGALLDSIP